MEIIEKGIWEFQKKSNVELSVYTLNLGTGT